MILTINHETVYRYESAVRHSTQYLRLTPQDGDGQRVLEWRLDLPAPAFSTRDSHGNVLHVMTLDMPHDEIRIRAVGIVETEEGDRMCFGAGDPRPFLRATPLTAMSQEMTAFAERFREREPGVDGVERLAHAVHAWLAYDTGATGAATPAADAFALARGVCQDHAQVFIACCRHLGIPARYVSGYLHAAGLRQEQHQASHAWAEAWLGDRWWSFDVANRCRAGGAHLKLAVGMDYLDACPVRGMRRGGGAEQMRADVSVQEAQAGPGAASQRQSMEQQQQ